MQSELLFHVISHLSADDLLSVKLVSRRFNDIVNSPHAWINAFSRYFPGPDALRATADTTNSDGSISDFKTDKRSFTRLSPVASWTGEYLLRTKLLRCLNRGRPALPFACPAPGKSNKGYATFTFSSRLRNGISHLHAKFGPVMDKRLPQFIHGFDVSGTVSSSDKRGKFDGWGIIDRSAFNNFAELYPGTAQWGLGHGEVVGVPNVMDLSATHGMVHGEGFPGGVAYYLASGEKHGHILAEFLSESSNQDGMPKLFSDRSSTCSVWMAKSPQVISTTKGLVGLLIGASNGAVSAHALGSSNDRDQRFERGELTARWMLSPGVPIIALAVDEQYTEERRLAKRVWAVALNTLGEVFVLRDAPEQSPMKQVSEEAFAYARETRAWRTGHSAQWRLVRASQRNERQISSELELVPEYYPRAVWDGVNSQENLRVIESWTHKTPSEVKADFNGWDMQRRIGVDFAGDDNKGAGENILVMSCGQGEDEAAAAIRYSHCTIFQRHREATTSVPATVDISAAAEKSIFNSPNWSFENSTTSRQQASTEATDAVVESGTEWRSSVFAFGRFKSVLLTTHALDQSLFATTTAAEDIALRRPRAADAARSKPKPSGSSAEGTSPLKSPGQRARFIAVGTGSGNIFVWDIRAPPSNNSKVTNTIRPFRVIHTDSPEITSLGLSALYLVHGGSEGLVQIWDPLASTLEPVRTISSRNTLNARRRAVIAAQSNPIVQVQMANTGYAASAICIDPDPYVLRGVVAMGSHLRYWSYSSADATDELSKSQKRRMNRQLRGLNSSSTDAYIGTRRVSLKGVVDQQMSERHIDLKERRAEQKAERRMAGRYGLDLLGDDASEEEMLAYAKLLSQEEQENRIREALAGQTKLKHDASEAEVEEYLNNLSEEDRRRWRYASWQDRYDIPISTEGGGSGVTSPPNTSPSPDETELEKALRLSLEDSEWAAARPRLMTPSHTASSSAPPKDDVEEAIRLSLMKPAPATDHLSQSSGSASCNADPSALTGFADGEVDDETLEAIRLSLAETASHLHPVQSNGVANIAPKSINYKEDEDDLAKAIRLSLQEQEGVPRIVDQDDFPTLSSTSSPGMGSGQHRRSNGRGKGKNRIIW
jgi:hypothetical protein